MRKRRFVGRTNRKVVLKRQMKVGLLSLFLVVMAAGGVYALGAGSELTFYGETTIRRYAFGDGSAFGAMSVPGPDLSAPGEYELDESYMPEDEDGSYEIEYPGVTDPEYDPEYPIVTNPEDESEDEDENEYPITADPEDEAESDLEVPTATDPEGEAESETEEETAAVPGDESEYVTEAPVVTDLEDE